jgi:Immunity protein 22
MMNQRKKVNRYGPPHFNKAGFVSIWVSVVPLNRIPDDYFEENYGGDEYVPLTPFYGDFGFGYFDHDFMDTNTSEGRATEIENLLGPCSYSASYVELAVAEAKRRGLEKTQSIVLLFDFKYDPDVSEITKSNYMEFLGSFVYDKKSPSAVNPENE